MTERRSEEFSFIPLRYRQARRYEAAREARDARVFRENGLKYGRWYSYKFRVFKWHRMELTVRHFVVRVKGGSKRSIWILSMLDEEEVIMGDNAAYVLALDVRRNGIGEDLREYVKNLGHLRAECKWVEGMPTYTGQDLAIVMATLSKDWNAPLSDEYAIEAFIFEMGDLVRQDWKARANEGKPQ